MAILERGIETTTRNGDLRPLIIGVVDIDILTGRHPTGSSPATDDATGHPDEPCSCDQSVPVDESNRPDAADHPGAPSPDGTDHESRAAATPSSATTGQPCHPFGAQPADAAAAAPGRIGRCALHGVGPVPVETIRRLLCEGDFCRVVLNGDSMPLDVGRRHRVATADQWRALFAVSGGNCEWPGCDAPAHWCQVHHFIPWDDDGPTNIDNPTSRQYDPPL